MSQLSSKCSIKSISCSVKEMQSPNKDSEIGIHVSPGKRKIINKSIIENRRHGSDDAVPVNVVADPLQSLHSNNSNISNPESRRPSMNTGSTLNNDALIKPIKMSTQINGGLITNQSTDDNRSHKSAKIQWKTLNHTLRIALQHSKDMQSRNKEVSSSRRDSFMDRFSTQRRGSYSKNILLSDFTDDYLSPNANDLSCRKPLIAHPNEDNDASAPDCISRNESNICQPNTDVTKDCHPVELTDLNNSIKHHKPFSEMPSIYKLKVVNEKDGKFELDVDDEAKCDLTCYEPRRCYLIWLSIISLAVLYNLWVLIARQAFPQLQTENTVLWFTLDAIVDLVYLFDIYVHCNTSYLKDGLFVHSMRKMALRYIKSYQFGLDLVSIFPLDLIQIKVGIQPMLRFNRFFKLYRVMEWKLRVENRTIFPNIWRVLNLVHILFLGCHWCASFFYMISRYENFEYSWNYKPGTDSEANDLGHIYLRCFYWATVTLTTIGDTPEPVTTIELAFSIVAYLSGVFVFATVVGQVGNIITTRNAPRIEFEQIMDNVKTYMRSNSVNPELQKRVLRWYDYAWSTGCGNGAYDINSIGMLPDKLKTELAINVNMKTIKKVTIFNECRPEFLHDLVLKMKPLLFTPGDMICRKGEVAREMFIIVDGILEVVSDSGEVLSVMSGGDFFGEIGILNLGGINKRTADVRAVGYTKLFALSREDVLEALKYHPDGEEAIKKYATRRLYETRGRSPSLRKPMKFLTSSISLSKISAQDKISSNQSRRGSDVQNYLSSKSQSRRSLDDPRKSGQGDVTPKSPSLSRKVQGQSRETIDSDGRIKDADASKDNTVETVQTTLNSITGIVENFLEKWDTKMNQILENYQNELENLRSQRRLV